MIKELKSNLTEIFNSRSILKSLVVKNLFGRYRNSVLGFGWHFIMPIMLLFIYYIVFTQIRSIPITNFWIYLASGLFPFHFIINNLTAGSSCIVGNAGMVKKMYFPREIIVLAQIISSFIILLISYIIVLIAIILSGSGLDVAIISLPLAFILLFIFTLGLGLIFSSLTVYLRDIQYFLSSTSMVFFFITPIYFIPDSIDGLFSIIVAINPFTYFVELFQDIVFYHIVPSFIHLIVSTGLSVISIISGVVIFQKLKIGFAERL